MRLLQDGTNELMEAMNHLKSLNSKLERAADRGVGAIVELLSNSEITVVKNIYKEFQGFIITFECGNPNVYIDTFAGYLEYNINGGTAFWYPKHETMNAIGAALINEYVY